MIVSINMCQAAGVLWRLVKFAYDPFGIVSNAGAAAQGIAQDGLATLMSQSGLLEAADLIGLNETTRSNLNRQVESFIANAHQPAGFRSASPFDTHFVVLMCTASKRGIVNVACRINPIALRFPAMTLIGMALLFESSGFARSASVYYSAGALFGTMIALAIVTMFVYRNRNNKLVIGGGVSAFFYGLYQNAVSGANDAESLAKWLERSLNLPEHSLSTGFVVFIVLVAGMVVLYLYIQGPIQNPRALNVIAGAFKLSGVTLLYCSSYSQTLGATLVVLNLLSMACGSFCTRAVFCCCGRVPGVGPLLQLIAEVIRLLTCSLCCRRPPLDETTVSAIPLQEALPSRDNDYRLGPQVPATREAIARSGAQHNQFAGSGVQNDQFGNLRSPTYTQQRRSMPREFESHDWRESPGSGARIQFSPKPARRASGMHEHSALYNDLGSQQLRRRIPSTDSKIRYRPYPDSEDEHDGTSYTPTAPHTDALMAHYDDYDDELLDELGQELSQTQHSGAQQLYSGRKRGRAAPTHVQEHEEDYESDYDDASVHSHSQDGYDSANDEGSAEGSRLSALQDTHAFRHGDMSKRQRR
jgi:hypothetical protein